MQEIETGEKSEINNNEIAELKGHVRTTDLRLLRTLLTQSFEEDSHHDDNEAVNGHQSGVDDKAGELTEKTTKNEEILTAVKSTEISIKVLKKRLSRKKKLLANKDGVSSSASQLSLPTSMASGSTIRTSSNKENLTIEKVSSATQSTNKNTGASHLPAAQQPPAQLNVRRIRAETPSMKSMPPEGLKSSHPAKKLVRNNFINSRNNLESRLEHKYEELGQLLVNDLLAGTAHVCNRSINEARMLIQNSLSMTRILSVGSASALANSSRESPGNNTRCNKQKQYHQPDNTEIPRAPRPNFDHLQADRSIPIELEHQQQQNLYYRRRRRQADRNSRHSQSEKGGEHDRNKLCEHHTNITNKDENNNSSQNEEDTPVTECEVTSLSIEPVSQRTDDERELTDRQLPGNIIEKEGVQQLETNSETQQFPFVSLPLGGTVKKAAVGTDHQLSNTTDDRTRKWLKQKNQILMETRRQQKKEAQINHKKLVQLEVQKEERKKDANLAFREWRRSKSQVSIRMNSPDKKTEKSQNEEQQEGAKEGAEEGEEECSDTQTRQAGRYPRSTRSAYRMRPEQALLLRKNHLTTCTFSSGGATSTSLKIKVAGKRLETPVHNELLSRYARRPQSAVAPDNSKLTEEERDPPPTTSLNEQQQQHQQQQHRLSYQDWLTQKKSQIKKIIVSDEAPTAAHHPRLSDCSVMTKRRRKSKIRHKKTNTVEKTAGNLHAQPKSPETVEKRSQCRENNLEEKTETNTNINQNNGSITNSPRNRERQSDIESVISFVEENESKPIEMERDFIANDMTGTADEELQFEDVAYSSGPEN